MGIVNVFTDDPIDYAALAAAIDKNHPGRLRSVPNTIIPAYTVEGFKTKRRDFVKSDTESKIERLVANAD